MLEPLISECSKVDCQRRDCLRHTSHYGPGVRTVMLVDIEDEYECEHYVNDKRIEIRVCKHCGSGAVFDFQNRRMGCQHCNYWLSQSDDIREQIAEWNEYNG